MSAPRAKRQFAGAASDSAQRQITSFFTSATGTPGSSPPDTSPISQTPSTQQPSSTPALPASVQANLLSVGMRIRKSVPEGYKTKGYNAFALWDERDTSPATAAMGEGQRSRANAFSSPRELLPFCGIHKVGGLDTQPADDHPTQALPSTRAGAPVMPAYQLSFGLHGADMNDDVPRLTSSQESIESSASDMALPPGVSAAGRRKRLYVEDGEDETAGQLNLWQYGPAPDVPNNNHRLIAVPRKPKAWAKSLIAASRVPEPEGLMVVDSDFEEAEFLDQTTWEVDMDDA
ncbi:hypothetical protein F4802DRAFT_583069 [Xylaria palmicola]|nr:hypothetical protein F4802DRAFT_583069 [Xylaria palmicola]